VNELVHGLVSRLLRCGCWWFWACGCMMDEGRRDSSGSGSDNDDDDEKGLDLNVGDESFAGTGADPRLDDLASEFGTHNFLDFGQDVAVPSPLLPVAGGNEGEEKQLGSYKSSSMKRKVAKEYSGRINRDEIMVRQKNSLQGSFRVAKGTSTFTDSDSVHRSTGMQSHDLLNANNEGESASQPKMVREVAQAALTANVNKQEKGLRTRKNSQSDIIKKHLNSFSDKVKNTVIRRLSTTNGKTDGRSAVDRCAARPRHWTKEEDDLLRRSVEIHGEKQWKKIADLVPGRNHTQCLQRWSKVLTPGLKKGQWSVEEDRLLLNLATAQLKACEAKGKPRKVQWGVVKNGIPGRTAKQCRERWVNNLNPEIRRGDWTEDEDSTIMELYQVMPQKWAAIAKHLEGRTENAVKIRWKSLNREDANRSAAKAAANIQRGQPAMRMQQPVPAVPLEQYGRPQQQQQQQQQQHNYASDPNIYAQQYQVKQEPYYGEVANQNYQYQQQQAGGQYFYDARSTPPPPAPHQQQGPYDVHVSPNDTAAYPKSHVSPIEGRGAPFIGIQEAPLEPAKQDGASKPQRPSLKNSQNYSKGSIGSWRSMASASETPIWLESVGMVDSFAVDSLLGPNSAFNFDDLPPSDNAEVSQQEGLTTSQGYTQPPPYTQ